MEFKEHDTALTFGVEVELQVLDKSSLNLVPRAAELLGMTSLKSLVKELFQSTVELISPVCENTAEAEKFFKTNFEILQHEGNQLGLIFASTGTHPFANYTERLITDSPRYQSIVSKNRWLIRRMAVYGMHVHLGMINGEECIRYHNFFTSFIPHLIALSASSPFWHGLDTELASCRPTMYEALPTAGIPYSVLNWQDYTNLVTRMVKVGSITSLKDIWWDVRPSPGLGTLEIRVCDAPATLQELLAITSFIHALAYWFEENKDKFSSENLLPLWITRENKWRAIRDGLSASFILSDHSDVVPLKEDIQRWIKLLEPQFRKLGYSKYSEYLSQIVSFGNSSFRQVLKFRETNDLHDVAYLNIKEFEEGRPA